MSEAKESTAGGEEGAQAGLCRVGCVRMSLCVKVGAVPGTGFVYHGPCKDVSVPELPHGFPRPVLGRAGI